MLKISQNIPGAANIEAPSKCRLVILDDQPIFCEGVKRYIDQQQNIEIVGIFDRKATAFKFLQTHGADLLLMELNLQHEVGLELLKDVRAEFGGLRVLVFTDRDERIYGERALLAGARGYLMKNSSHEVLMDVIPKIMRDEVHLSEQLMSFMLKRMFVNKFADTNPVTALSDREFEVFEMIGSGKGTKQIATILKLSVKTVENHREKIKKKLGVDCGTSMVHYATVWVYQTATSNRRDLPHAAMLPPVDTAQTAPLACFA